MYCGWKPCRRAVYYKPVLSILFLNGKKIECSPEHYILNFDEHPYYDWKLWIDKEILIDRFPLATIQEVTVNNWDIIPIICECTPLVMTPYSHLTYNEIQEIISEKIIKKA